MKHSGVSLDCAASFIPDLALDGAPVQGEAGEGSSSK